MFPSMGLGVLHLWVYTCCKTQNASNMKHGGKGRILGHSVGSSSAISIPCQRATGFFCGVLLLKDRARVEMDTVAYVEHGGALAGRSLQVDGDLTLRQTCPLSVYGGDACFLAGLSLHSPLPPPQYTTKHLCIE